MSGLEAEVTQRMQHLQLLTAENNMLKLRASVLEAAVAGREHVVRCRLQRTTCRVHGRPGTVCSSLPDGANTLQDSVEMMCLLFCCIGVL
jgi:hypothetical protein